MQLYCALRMAWPALLWLSSHVLLPRVLADVESNDDGETSGERARHLATLRKRKQRAAYRTEANRPEVRTLFS